MLQVLAGEFQGLGRGVVGQFGVQGRTADGRQVGALQLLVQHPRSAGLALMGLAQGLGVAVCRQGWRGRLVVAPQVAEQGRYQDQQQQGDQVAVTSGHRTIRGGGKGRAWARWGVNATGCLSRHFQRL
ncbi:hypothetical protein D9M71_659110 [compost metagenome]